MSSTETAPARTTSDLDRHCLPTGTLILETYRIDDLLGRGGFGNTYRATDVRLGMQVAIKEFFHADSCVRVDGLAVMPRPGAERIFDWGRRSFLAEARLLAMFDHPGIVHVLNVMEANNTAYFVMKLEPGRPLKSWLADRGRVFEQKEFDRLIVPLLSALEAMHANGCIHRDLSCDNIMIRLDGSPVLIDFGAARRLVAEETQQLTGLVKSGYSPPEQYVSKGGRQGPWTDIYALGAVLYFAISGRMPPPSPTRMIEDDYVPLVEQSAGKFRHACLAAIDHALSLLPEDRPQTLAQWRLELFRTDDQPAHVADCLTTAIPFTRPTANRTPAAATSVRPYRAWSIAVAALAIAVPAAMTFVQISEEKSSPAANVTRQVETSAHRNNLDRVQQVTRRLLAARDWSQMQSRPSLAAMQAYVASHPKGSNAPTARRLAAAFGNCSGEAAPASAIQACEALIRQYPDFAEAYNWLGRALGRAGRPADAIASHNQALQRAPHLTSVYAWRGQWHQALGQKALASADFNLAVRFEAKTGDDLLARGMAHLALSRADAAVSDLDRAIAEMPASWIAHLTRARANELKHVAHAALADYRRVVTLNASHAVALAAIKRLEQAPRCKAGS